LFLGEKKSQITLHRLKPTAKEAKHNANISSVSNRFTASHCSVRFIGLRLWYAGIALCFPIFGIFLPIYCAILFFERNILTFVAQSVKIVVKGQLALALTFMESRYGDG
jgi:hypothetical protein